MLAASIAYRLNEPNAAVASGLGRTLSGNAANLPVALLEPAIEYGKRYTQVDLRAGKLLRVSRARMLVTFDLYNAFNANPMSSTIVQPWRSAEKRRPGRVRDVGHRRFQIGHSASGRGGGSARRGDRFGAPFLERQRHLMGSSLGQQRLHPLHLCPGVRNLGEGVVHGNHAALCVLQQPALERATTLRPMRVDTAPRAVEASAGKRQQLGVGLVVIDVQAQNLESRGFGWPGQLHVTKQRAVAA